MSQSEYFEEQLSKVEDDSVAELTALCRKLQDQQPGSRVPLIDPVHDVDEARVISLQIAPGPVTSSGFLSLRNDDPTAARLAAVYEAAGLEPRFGIPWNVFPWELPDGGTKLTPDQVKAGIRPLKELMRIAYRTSAIVAHGTEAKRLVQAWIKAGGQQVINQRGIKIYEVRSTADRAFLGSAEKQQAWFDEMVAAYTDAMARAGLRPAGK